MHFQQNGMTYDISVVMEKLGEWDQQKGPIHRPKHFRKESNVLFNDTLNTFYLWL